MPNVHPTGLCLMVVLCAPWLNCIVPLNCSLGHIFISKTNVHYIYFFFDLSCFPGFKKIYNNGEGAL